MVHLCRRLLQHTGIDPERLVIDWCDAGEGIRFGRIMNEFSGKIKKLGPLGKSEGIDKNEVRSKLEELMKLVPYIKLVKQEKLESHLENLDDYDELFTSEEIETLLSEVPSYWIDPTKCQACMMCARRCPVDAIISAKNQIHVIEQARCIKCGSCFEACPPKFGAVMKIVGEPVPPPLPENERTIVRKSKQQEAA
jgi:Fe-S-cluster-containing hydrogenase component 2